MRRIKKGLDKQKYQDQFSHTILHKQVLFDRNMVPQQIVTPYQKQQKQKKKRDQLQEIQKKILEKRQLEQEQKKKQAISAMRPQSVKGSDNRNNLLIKQQPKEPEKKVVVEYNKPVYENKRVLPSQMKEPSTAERLGFGGGGLGVGYNNNNKKPEYGMGVQQQANKKQNYHFINKKPSPAPTPTNVNNPAANPRPPQSYLYQNRKQIPSHVSKLEEPPIPKSKINAPSNYNEKPAAYNNQKAPVVKPKMIAEPKKVTPSKPPPPSFYVANYSPISYEQVKKEEDVQIPSQKQRQIKNPPPPIKNNNYVIPQQRDFKSQLANVHEAIRQVNKNIEKRPEVKDFKIQKQENNNLVAPPRPSVQINQSQIKVAEKKKKLEAQVKALIKQNEAPNNYVKKQDKKVDKSRQQSKQKPEWLKQRQQLHKGLKKKVKRKGWGKKNDPFNVEFIGMAQNMVKISEDQSNQSALNVEPQQMLFSDDQVQKFSAPSDNRVEQQNQIFDQEQSPSSYNFNYFNNEQSEQDRKDREKIKNQMMQMTLNSQSGIFQEQEDANLFYQQPPPPPVSILPKIEESNMNREDDIQDDQTNPDSQQNTARSSRNNNNDDKENKFGEKMEIDKMKFSLLGCVENLTIMLEDQLGDNVFKAFQIVRKHMDDIHKDGVREKAIQELKEIINPADVERTIDSLITTQLLSETK